jgi:hypothetical protein
MELNTVENRIYVQQLLKILNSYQYAVIIGTILEGRTLEDVAKEVKRTRDSVRQTRNKSLKKMKQHDIHEEISSSFVCKNKSVRRGLPSDIQKRRKYSRYKKVETIKRKDIVPAAISTGKSPFSIIFNVDIIREIMCKENK